VSVPGAPAEMLVIDTTENDPHWNDTARKLVCDLLVYGGTPVNRDRGLLGGSV